MLRGLIVVVGLRSTTAALFACRSASMLAVATLVGPPV